MWPLPGLTPQAIRAEKFERRKMVKEPLSGYETVRTELEEVKKKLAILAEKIRAGKQALR